MYKDDMNEIYSQKREALTLFLGYSIPILLKLYMFMPGHVTEIKRFIKVIKSYIKYHNEEKEILRLVKKKYGKIESIDYIDLILNNLEQLFVDIYNNYQDIINDYEDMLYTKDTYRAVIPKDKVLSLDLELKRKYINELGDK